MKTPFPKLIVVLLLSSCFNEERCTEDGYQPEDIFLEFRIVNSDNENLLTGPFSDSGCYNVENIEIIVNENIVQKQLNWTRSCSYFLGFKPFEADFFTTRGDIFKADSIPILIKLNSIDVDTLSMSYKIIDDSGCGFYEFEKLILWYNGDSVLYNDPCIAYDLIKK